MAGSSFQRRTACRGLNAGPRQHGMSSCCDFAERPVDFPVDLQAQLLRALQRSAGRDERYDSEPKRFLAPGDVMEVTIDGIGILANPCT